MSRWFRLAILGVVLGAVGCSSSSPPSDAESAARTLREMLALAEVGDWAGYVDGYYGESHKFRSDDDRRALVRRFEERWGGDVVPALRKAVKVTPEIVDGNQVEFRVDGETVFILYRTDSGGWAFHL